MKRSLVQLATMCSLLWAGALVSVTPVHAGSLPATGQTTAYQARKSGDPGEVPVPDDGTLQLGAALHYKMLKDGTLQDLNTGLIWEVKCSGCGNLHDVGNFFLWSWDGFSTDATIWDWLDEINAEGGKGYAGHHDWRIPNVRELQSIVDYEEFTPAIDPLFGPTDPSPYWSSTSYAYQASSDAWYVDFNAGNVLAIGKSAIPFRVRAVRGGPK